MRSRVLPFVVLCLATISFVACGSKQGGGMSAGGDCPALTAEGMSNAAWNAWAQCTTRAGAAANSAVCGEALRASRSATPAALHAATTCILDSENRADITYIGDGLHGIAFEDDKVVAIAEALPGHFNPERHGNILAGSITENGQLALGRMLDQLDDPAVELLFNFSLRHNLTLLAGHFDNYDGAATLRASADPVLVDQFARQISNDHDYGETERWALARSGIWSADDIIRCQTNNLRGCDNWDGERPMSLLDEATERGSDARTPGMIVAAAGLEGSTREDAGAAVRWISRTPGSGGAGQLRSMINGMTTPSNREDFRYGVALAATAELCAVPLVSQAARRASADDDQSQTNVWNTFLTRCNDAHWTWRERLELSTLGSALHAHRRVLEAIVSAAETTSSEVTCSQLHTAADEIHTAQQAYDRPMIGLVYGLAADLRTDCYDAFRADLRRVAGDSAEHPESRFKAIEVLAEHGDNQFCSSRSSIRSWTPGEDQAGFTPLAEELELKAADACP